MLCWGYWSLGQPGISSNLRPGGIVAEPQVCRFISDRTIKEVACGGNHSVFLLEGGEVYTCGVNTKGQLGHEREGNKPGECRSCLGGQDLAEAKGSGSFLAKPSASGKLWLPRAVQRSAAQRSAVFPTESNLSDGMEK